jgi:uncharacterized protein
MRWSCVGNVAGMEVCASASANAVARFSPRVNENHLQAAFGREVSVARMSKVSSRKSSAGQRQPLFRLRRSSIQGRGLFAARTIRKGTRIIEYTGERIGEEEADKRYDEKRMRRHHTFLFTLTPKVVVDGAVGGNESIYINHSCDPNCEAVIYDRKIFIHALRTIYPGEELVYDYQYEHTSKADEKYYVCRCGASQCRGTIMKLPRKRRTTKGTKTRSRG